jgi:putative PIN family toxin of toxin-antitoxin system
MKVAFDSSALIAAVLTAHGVSSGLLNHIIEEHELIASDFILDEVCRKLRTKFHFDEERVIRVATDLRPIATLVHPAPLPATSCRDPEDIPILGTAVAGNVSFLVSVDKDLLSIGEFRGMQIVRPGEFFKRTRTR